MTKNEVNLTKKTYWLLALVGAYCVISVMMNFLCMKPLSFGTNFIWMDGGLLVSWMVFLISNVITEVYGKKTAVHVTTIAAVVALFVSVIAALEVYIPSLPQYADQSEHFANVFSNGPRTIISSTIAFWLGNLVNVEIISLFKSIAEKHQNDNALRFIFRAVFSTIIGQFVDNGLFQTLAFAPVGLSMFEMQWHDITTAVLMSTLVETTLEAFFVPIVTIPCCKKLQKMADA